MKNIQNAFKPNVIPKTKLGNAGYDNARENIDPHIRTGAVTSKEGTIQNVPINAKDITNKEYVDSINTQFAGLNPGGVYDYVSYTYDEPDGFRMTTATFKVNGVSGTTIASMIVTYNAKGYIETITTTKNTVETVESFAYTYNSDGWIETITKT